MSDKLERAVRALLAYACGDDNMHAAVVRCEQARRALDEPTPDDAELERIVEAQRNTIRLLHEILEQHKKKIKHLEEL